jgi:hypothetical protein
MSRGVEIMVRIENLVNEHFFDSLVSLQILKKTSRISVEEVNSFSTGKCSIANLIPA